MPARLIGGISRSLAVLVAALMLSSILAPLQSVLAGGDRCCNCPCPKGKCLCCKRSSAAAKGPRILAAFSCSPACGCKAPLRSAARLVWCEPPEPLAWIIAAHRSKIRWIRPDVGGRAPASPVHDRAPPAHASLLDI